MSSLLNRQKKFWEKYEASIIEIIKLAIHNFLKSEKLPTNEDDLNREFFKCLVSANHALRNKSRGQDSPPIYEANNQPHYSDINRSEREYKRPDFQWSITDIYEDDPYKSSKQFVLECKRLGKPVGSWRLNENYVRNGIVRFIKKEYGYAKGVKSSAMLGYIQSMEPSSILTEINHEVTSLHQEKLYKTETTKLVHYYTHKISVESSDLEFCLEHLWVDIKDFN